MPSACSAGRRLSAKMSDDESASDVASRAVCRHSLRALPAELPAARRLVPPTPGAPRKLRAARAPLRAARTQRALFGSWFWLTPPCAAAAKSAAALAAVDALDNEALDFLEEGDYARAVDKLTAAVTAAEASDLPIESLESLRAWLEAEGQLEQLLYVNLFVDAVMDWTPPWKRSPLKTQREKAAIKAAAVKAALGPHPRCDWLGQHLLSILILVLVLALWLVFKA